MDMGSTKWFRNSTNIPLPIVSGRVRSDKSALSHFECHPVVRPSVRPFVDAHAFDYIGSHISCGRWIIRWMSFPSNVSEETLLHGARVERFTPVACATHYTLCVCVCVCVAAALRDFPDRNRR